MVIRLFLSLTLLIVLCSCGSGDESDIRDSAVNEALIYLNSKNCSDALAILTEAGNFPFNADYVSTLAATYACGANFSEITFFTEDIGKISFTNNNFLGSLASLSSSVMTDPNDASFESLLLGIHTLAYAGNVTLPTHASRATQFSGPDLANMNAQLLYMQIAQLGKFANFYGDGNSTETKGSGGNNNCFFEYTTSDALFFISQGITGPCILGEPGHLELDVSVLGLPLVVSRMCEGVVLFNQFINTLVNTLISGGASAGLSGIDGTLETYLNPLCSSSQLDGICSVTKQSICEDSYGVDPADPSARTDFNLLQNYFAAIFESLYTNP